MADRWGQFRDADEPGATYNWEQFRDAPGAAEDVLRTIPAGLRRGVVSVPGIPGSIEQLGRMGIDWAARKMGFSDPKTVEGQVLPTSADYVRGDEELTGEKGYQPQTTAGEYANTIAEFAPGALAPGGFIQRALLNVAAPAVASEAAGQLTKGSDFEPVARIGGALVGGHVGGRVVTPAPATPTRQNFVRTLENEGVELTAGQRTGSRPMQWIESAAADTPFSSGRAREIADTQKRQYTQAVLARIGEVGDEASPEVMRQARERIGAEFDRITRHPLDFTFPTAPSVRQNLAQAIQRAEIEYENTVPAAARNSHIPDIVDEINYRLIQGRIDGDTAQAWRSRFGRMADSANDPQQARFFGAIQRAIDDAYEAALPAAEAQAWREARSQYAHLKELQFAMKGGGEDLAHGLVSPQRLRQADVNANDVAYVEGRGRYSDLARAGVATMPQLPNSGTPARLAAQGLASAVMGAGGYLAGGAPGAAIGTLTGAAAPGMMFRAYLNPWVQGYLGNQRLAPQLNARPGASMSAPQVLTAPAQGTSEDIPAVKSFEEALRLKKGQEFIDPQGVRRVR